MIPRQLGMQGNDAMYSNAKVWMQTFDCCCTLQFKIITSCGDSQPIESGWYCLLRDQCFRLHLKFGIAVAQQESCWRSQQSAVSCQQSADSSQQSAVSVCVEVIVKGQGEGRSLALFFLSWYGDCCVGPSCANAIVLCLLFH